MKEQQITVDDLLKKIGAMTIQIELYQSQIAQLQERIENLSSIIQENQKESSTAEK